MSVGQWKHFLVEKILDGYQFLGTNQVVHEQLFDLVSYHEVFLLLTFLNHRRTMCFIVRPAWTKDTQEKLKYVLIDKHQWKKQVSFEEERKQQEEKRFLKLKDEPMESLKKHENRQ